MSKQSRINGQSAPSKAEHAEQREQSRGISPQNVDTMPRAEDDPEVLEKSPEFHDRPDGATKDSAPH